MEISLAIIIVVAALIVMAARYRQSRTDARERRLRYGKHGELAAIEEVLGQPPLHLNGKGNYTTQPLQLEAGTYKVHYRFPDDILVKVDLWHEGEAETVAVKKGTGTASFTIADNGRYTFDIAPVDEKSPWALEITRLGLPSRPPSL